MTDEQEAEVVQRYKEAIALDYVIPFRLIELFKTSRVDMREVLRANSIRDMLTADEAALFDSMKKHADEPQA